MNHRFFDKTYWFLIGLMLFIASFTTYIGIEYMGMVELNANLKPLLDLNMWDFLIVIKIAEFYAFYGIMIRMTPKDNDKYSWFLYNFTGYAILFILTVDATNNILTMIQWLIYGTNI